MNRHVLFAVPCALLLAVTITLGAEPAELKPFAFLIGEWPSSGAGAPGTGAGGATFSRGLQDRVIIRNSFAEYPPDGSKPGTRHDDLLILYAASGAVRADYYDNEGHVIRYAVTSPAPGQAVFVSDPVAGQPRFRLTYRAAADGATMEGEFAIAPPGTPEAFKPYLSWQSRRARRGA